MMTELNDDKESPKRIRKPISVTLSPEIYSKLEILQDHMKIDNRSQLLNKILADAILQYYTDDITSQKLCIGIVTLVYPHNKKPGLLIAINDIQHEMEHHHDHQDQDNEFSILFSTHIHATHDICTEIIAVRGQRHLIKALADKLAAIDGILTAKDYVLYE